MENPFESLQKQIANLESLVSQLLAKPSGKDNAQELPIKLEQAAELLMISTSAVYKNIDSIPHRKRHGQYYFFPSELIEYLNQGSDVIAKRSTIIKPRRTRQKTVSDA